jgi:hypothetical protein
MANIASIVHGTSRVRQCRLHPSICGRHRRQIGSPDDLLARHNTTAEQRARARPPSTSPSAPGPAPPDGARMTGWRRTSVGEHPWRMTFWREAAPLRYVGKPATREMFCSAL